MDRGRASYHQKLSGRLSSPSVARSFSKSKIQEGGSLYCARNCYSTISFRPKTANTGYRTRLACCQGYNSERLGHVFENSSHPDPESDTKSEKSAKFGIGLSRKVSTVESRIAAGFASPQPSPPVKEKVKSPKCAKSAKAPPYASEFFRMNPCLAYLPRHKEKRKKKKKKEQAVKCPPQKKCMCEVHVNTVPMTNTKFTETDFLTYDQCTWTDVTTSDKGSGPEPVTTCDQFTNVTPEDIDGPPDIPEYYRASSFFLPDDDEPESEFEARMSSAPSKMSFGQQFDYVEKASRKSRSSHTVVGPPARHVSTSHTLVDHPPTLSRSPCVTVPASFNKMNLGHEEGPHAWDGVVYSCGEMSCCPPCVSDPSVLNRFWRRTPKFCDVVRVPPLCDCCCLAILNNGGGKSMGCEK